MRFSLGKKGNISAHVTDYLDIKLNLKFVLAKNIVRNFID